MVGKKQPVAADDYHFNLAENAKAVEAQAVDNPGVGIPVHPKVAEYMGAFADLALSQGNAENETEDI